MSMSYWMIEGIGLNVQDIKPYINMEKAVRFFYGLFPNDPDLADLIAANDYASFDLETFYQGNGFENLADVLCHCDDTSSLIHLIPLTGSVAYISKNWHELPEEGLNAVCLSLEQQINREARQEKKPPQSLLRVIGDPCDPLVSALLALQPEKLDGLIKVTLIGGSALSIQEVPRRQLSYLNGVDKISQLLQDNGYEAASKFIDCIFEL